MKDALAQQKAMRQRRTVVGEVSIARRLAKQVFPPPHVTKPIASMASWTRIVLRAQASMKGTEAFREDFKGTEQPRSQEASI